MHKSSQNSTRIRRPSIRLVRTRLRGEVSSPYPPSALVLWSTPQSGLIWTEPRIVKLEIEKAAAGSLYWTLGKFRSIEANGCLNSVTSDSGPCVAFRAPNKPSMYFWNDSVPSPIQQLILPNSTRRSDLGGNHTLKVNVVGILWNIKHLINIRFGYCKHLWSPTRHVPRPHRVEGWRVERGSNFSRSSFSTRKIC